jgi:hypothetical protein
MIAKIANPNWNTRDPVVKWLALDERYESADGQLRKVYRDKPHLPKPQKT